MGEPLPKNIAHIIQTRPDSVLGVQVRGLATCQCVYTSLDSGLGWRVCEGAEGLVGRVRVCEGVCGSGSSNSPRQALRTSIKSQFWKILITFGDKYPRNGSTNEPMAPRTSLG